MDLHNQALAAAGIVFSDALLFDRGAAPVFPSDTDHPRFEEMDNAHFIVLRAAMDWDADTVRDCRAEQAAFWRAANDRCEQMGLARDVAAAEAVFKGERK